jgi:hypothetical protein
MLNIINALRNLFTETRTKEIIGEVQEAGSRDADLLCDAYFQGFRERMESRAAEMQERFLSLNLVVPQSLREEVVYNHSSVAVFPENINETNWKDYRGTIDLTLLSWNQLRALAKMTGVDSRQKRLKVERALARKGF